MNKKVILLLLIIGLVTLSTVNAEDTITITVGAKHIEGTGTSISPLFLISSLDGNGYYSIITNDYPVYFEDYYKISVGDTVTLKVNNDGFCELIDKDTTDKGWF